MFGSRIHKLTWGLRTVGLPNTVVGLARMARLTVRRPKRAQVRLRSGGIVSFANPAQRVPALILFGDVIDPELFLVRRVLAPGSLVFDVGAAIGQFTVFVGQTERTFVHAYEPSSANITSLRRNIELNRLGDRVDVHHAALSTTEGTAAFRTAPNAYLSGMADHDVYGETESVPVHTLHGEADRLGVDRVNCLKVNVAGFESAVLEGALPLFEAGRVDLLIVLIGSTVVPVLRRIASLGYRFFFFDPFRVTLHELERIDGDSLGSPPTPARHVLGVRPQLLESGVLASIPVHRHGGARPNGD